MDELVANFYWWDNQVSICSDGSVCVDRRLRGRVDTNGDVLVDGEPIANIRPDGEIWTDMECVGHLVPGYAFGVGIGGVQQGPFYRLDDAYSWGGTASQNDTFNPLQSGGSYGASASGDSKFFGCIGAVVIACLVFVVLGWVWSMVVAAGMGVAYVLGAFLGTLWNLVTYVVTPVLIVFLIASFIVGKVTGISLLSRIRYKLI